MVRIALGGMVGAHELSGFLAWRSFSAEPLQNGQRRWRDGSLEEDLPMRSLSEMFNVNYFLVSQTNPHIVPVLNLKKRVNRKLGNLLEAEWKHRCAVSTLSVPLPFAEALTAAYMPIPLSLALEWKHWCAVLPAPPTPLPPSEKLDAVSMLKTSFSAALPAEPEHTRAANVIPWHCRVQP